MNTLEFIASLVSSLAWPFVAVVIVLVFRKAITKLIDGIKEAKWGDGTITIDRKLDKAEESGRMVLASLDRSVGLQPAFANAVPEFETDRFTRLLSISPGLVVIEAWGEIEGAMRELGVKHGVSDKALASSANEMAKALRSQGVLKPEVSKWLLEMRQVRNAAAHSKEVTETDALRFLELSRKVREVLKHL